MRWCLSFVAVAALCASAASAAPFARPGENIALHRPYTCSPDTNYPYCKDARDGVKLTDGVYTEGHFWTQQTTAGWSGARPVQITVDLGRVKPICGASFDTAAGVAGVGWPQSIGVFVSDDGKTWWRSGELVALGAANGTPPAEGYAVRRFWTDRLRCRGRYVAFQVDPGGAYTFCDELEVYRGPESLMAAPRVGPPVTDLRAAFLQQRATTAVRNRILLDAAAVRKEVGEVPLSPTQRTRLLTQLAYAEAAARTTAVPPGFVATLPLGPAHARVFAVQAAVWRAHGRKPCVWQTNPWDRLQPSDTPPPSAAKPAIHLTMLRGEVRGATINITSSADHALSVRLRAAGLPAGCLDVRQVPWTGTAAGPPTASALPEAKRTAGGWLVSVPSGVTQQVWLSVDSHHLAPGTHRGRLLLSAGRDLNASVPLTFRVSSVRMPQRLSLSLGGWDYTDSPTYGVTDRNMASVVAFLKRWHVDAPWANPGTMPFGDYDASGAMVQPPDTARMDRWLARWKGARYYMVFVSVGEDLPDSPAGWRKATAWIDFWVRHLAAKGVRASQLGLLLVDEPSDEAMSQRIVSWAKVIRQAQPQVIVFEDPTWRDPSKAPPDLYACSTMLCPNRPMWLDNRRLFEKVFLAQERAGKKLAFYSCSGPARSLDPYSYYRLQAWDCFRYGAVHEAFWAFGDTGGGSSWNEYALPGTCYAPEFLGPAGCTTSKQMEGIREGMYDYETLALLRKAVAAAERRGRANAVVAEAKRLLAEGPVRVTEAPGASDIEWAAAKDRGLADRVRVRAIALLSILMPLHSAAR